MSGTNLSVVVPCYNEEESARRFEADMVAPLDSLGIPYELVFVDDGSTDGTFAVLSALAGRRPQARTVRLPENHGLGMALRAGFLACSGPWIATLDADLTFHPAQLSDLMRRQRETGADLVAGSPFLAPTGLAQVPWVRRGPSAVINGLYRRLFGVEFAAYTPIFRLYRASALKSLRLTSRGFEINAEIAVRFILAGRRLAEAPALLTCRRQGSSKLNRLREAARHAMLIARLLEERRQARA